MTAEPAAPPPAQGAPLHARIIDTATAPDRIADARLVMLHGVFMDGSMWADVLDGLTGSRAIVVDMPAHGANPDLPDGSSLDDHVTAVAATLDALGVRDAVVLGHSWGGMVALRLAHRRADLVAGLVLANTPLERVGGTSRVGFHLQRILLAGGFSLGAYGRIAASALIGPDHRRDHPGAVDALAARTRRMGRRRVRDTLRSVLLEPGDAVDLMATVPVPWTLVAGEDDYVLGAATRQTLAPSGRVSIARGGHATPLEDPGALVDAVRTMVADLAAAVR